MVADIAAVITDLDGTLIDTRAANLVAYQRAFERIGLTFSEARYREAFGLPFAAMMALVAPGATAGQAAAVRDAKAEVYAAALELSRPNSALIALLRSMKGVGIPIGLATTARHRNTEAVLSHWSIESLFDVVIGAEDVSQGKPAPDCYLLAADRLEVDPSRCLVFEDSVTGVEAARAARCQVIEVRV